MNRPYTLIASGTALAIGAVLALAAIQPNSLRTANTMRVPDFGAYWSATRVALAGGNPYDESELLAVQQQIEPQREEGAAAWSPPWAFAALVPFAHLDFPSAFWVWRFFVIGSLFASATAIWQAYRSPPSRLIWAWSSVLMWYPTLQLIGLGQHSNFALLGVAGWLVCQALGKSPFFAGAWLALVLVKPQNLYLLGLVGIVWSVHRRQWRLTAGAVTATAIFTVAVLLVNPNLFRDYTEAFRARPPAQYVPPTIGMLLRMLFGMSNFWLVFLPPIAGMVWAVWYYWHHRNEWNWTERAPVIVLVSCITSPYGWMYDQVLFLLPLIAILARASHRPDGTRLVLMVVVILSAICMALHGAGFREVTFVWFAPLCLVLYLIASYWLERTQSFSNNS